jgi:hypothetical protein
MAAEDAPMKYVTRRDGGPAIADDMNPGTRAILLLLEHANARRAAGLALPCRCAECARHRTAIRCTTAPDGTLIIEAV